MNKLKEIKRLRNLAEYYQLENCEIMYRYKMSELCSIYNGIGPDAFPEWLRSAITTLNPSLAVVAFIHDLEWHESDGSKEKFTESNTRFKTNGYRVAQTEYPWYRPHRYAIMAQAAKFAKICQHFGWEAWCSPSEAK